MARVWEKDQQDWMRTMSTTVDVHKLITSGGEKTGFKSLSELFTEEERKGWPVPAICLGPDEQFYVLSSDGAVLHIFCDNDGKLQIENDSGNETTIMELTDTGFEVVW